MPEYRKKNFEQEKLFSGLWFRNYGMVVLGSFLVALGYVFFIVPHNIVPGGVFGFSIIVNYLIKLVLTASLSGTLNHSKSDSYF